MPDWFEPMAATLTEARFDGPDWTFEQKHDGIRLLAYKNGRDVRLWSRNRLPLNDSYPLIVASVAALPTAQLILDGEAAWERGGRASYHVFDVPWHDGDMCDRSLDERRALLAALPLDAPLTRVDPLDEPEPWLRACREGWEGVIAKRRDSHYEHRRSRAWLKMKCESVADFVIAGFTDPQGARVGLGALLVAHWRGESLQFAGKVGTGFDTALLRELRARLDTLEQPTPPFAVSKGLPRLGAHWVRPIITVRVAFLEWTGHGKLRHARLLAVTS